MLADWYKFLPDPQVITFVNKQNNSQDSKMWDSEPGQNSRNKSLINELVE